MSTTSHTSSPTLAPTSTHPAMHTIGKLAAAAMVSSDAIRYYEKEGLLIPSRKSEAGYRLYDNDALRRLRFIKQAQQCGFSLAEIRELLALKTNAQACCSDVRGVALAKKLQLEQKIRALQSMSQALTNLITSCAGAEQPLQDCPILAALETSMSRSAS